MRSVRNGACLRILKALAAPLLSAALLLSGCGPLPAEPSSETEKEPCLLEGYGLKIELPASFVSAGECVAKDPESGCEVVLTCSDHALKDVTEERLKTVAGVRTVSEFRSASPGGVPGTVVRFTENGRACALILTENRAGRLVCAGVSGLPEGWSETDWPITLTDANQPEDAVNQSLSDPAPSAMHSDGISPITGTFIQPWLYANYTEERWEKEFTLMREMGIDRIILGDTLTVETGNPITDVSQYVVTAAYPTENPAFRTGRDVVTPLFEHCKAYGMKLYVGMGNTSQGWPYLSPDTLGLKEVATVFADAAEDLYRVYYDRYPETFAGFYFVPELYNSSEFDSEYNRNRYAGRLAEGMQPIFDRIHEISDLPFIFSPYVNMFGGSWVSKDPDHIALFWEAFLREAGFRDGDILCPQDSVGAGGNDLEGLEAVTTAYRKAVDGCGKNILLWSNAELFIQPTGKFFDNYDGYGGYWSTCTVDRMIEQFRIASRYVDRIVTFAFPHYLSPYNTTEGYLNAYLGYLRTGLLETEKPLPPDAFRTLKLKQGDRFVLQISWSGMYDACGVHRVNIYRDGELYSYRNSTRNEGSESKKAEYPFSFVDPDFDFDGDPVTYSFEVVDCAGNVSERTDLTVDPASVPNGVSLGSVYRGSDAAAEAVRLIRERED